MSYLAFLLTFLVPPIAALLVLLRWRVERLSLTVLALVAIVALIYTGPWDNAIILNGVWSFNPGQVLGPVIGVVPLEEYLFYILQVAFTGLLTVWLLRRPRAGHG